MAVSLKIVSKSLDDVSKHTLHPEKYLDSQLSVAKQLNKTTKALYDLLKQLEDVPSSGTMPALLVDKFDDEQIWQQIELHNVPRVTSLVDSVSRATAGEQFRFGTVKSAQTTVDSFELNNTLSRLSKEKTFEDAVESDDDDRDSDLSGLDDLGSDEDLDGDESEEEKEMIQLLNKIHSTAEKDDDEGDDDDDDGDGDGAADSGGDGNESGSNDEVDISTKAKHIQRTQKKKRRVTEVDDKFFKISELEEFLDTEDLREEKRQRQESADVDVSESSEDDVDMFAADEEDDKQKDSGFSYAEFFDPPQTESDTPGNMEVTGDDDDDDNDNDDDDDDDEEEESSEGEDIEDVLPGRQPQSSAFEKRQLKMKEKIRQLEEVNLSEKPWQLVGEVSSGARPENSLLAETLDYDQTNKLPPVITEETTMKLEDIIKQRIRDKAWDDVERKEKKDEDSKEYKRRLVLDQEKSQLSLSQIYEKEYLKKTQSEEQEEKRDPQHEIIEKMMSSLFTKLDALSNYHYTPKPAIPDVKIVSNLPSVSMEEVIPSSVSDAALLAPEEVQEKKKGELKGSTERTVTDRKRERREKKLRQRLKSQARERKEKAKEKNEGAKSNKSKAEAMKEMSKKAKSVKGLTVLEENKNVKTDKLTSSKNFFTQLQEEVTTQIRSKKASAKKRKTEKTTADKYIL